jgi:uncharacterized protein with ParB-like and HNH nuclease domain
MDNTMKAAEFKLIDFFREPVQMISANPRGYHWTKEECQKLWGDIMRAAKDDSIYCHYIGTMIYVERGILARTPIPRYLLIDGQQRLATLSLIIIALEETKGWQQDSLSKEIHDILLFNPQGKGEFHYKLVLIGKDEVAFLSIARGEPQPTSNLSTLADNFIYLKELIEKSGVNSALVYRGIAKLTFMPVSTDQPYDNPQFVYESINRTGLDDDQRSLIQNWLGFLGSSPP